MSDPIRRPRRPVVAALALVFVIGACSTTSPSDPLSAPPAATPTTPPTSTIVPPPTSTTPPTQAPTPTLVPATPTPSPTPAPTASAAEACPIAPQTGRLPSDRLTDVRISSTATADLVTFAFGNMSVPEPPQGTSEGSLDSAAPPYTEAASGLPVKVEGDHVAQVRFSGMSLANDVGEPTYDGRLRFSPGLPALKTVANFDMSEGVVGWYVGYDGNGCVTLRSDATTVTLVVDHPRG